MLVVTFRCKLTRSWRYNNDELACNFWVPHYYLEYSSAIIFTNNPLGNKYDFSFPTPMYHPIPINKHMFILLNGIKLFKGCFDISKLF